MDDLFIKDTIVQSISVEPKYINNRIDDYILKRIKEKLEGKCIKNGYIKPGSIKILKRSMGKLVCSHFNGSVIYDIQISMDLCNPLKDTIIEVEVLNNNKMGILAGVPYDENTPLNILLPRQYHIDNDDFSKLSVGDLISIKIIGKRFEYGDTQISIIGIMEDNDSKSTSKSSKSKSKSSSSDEEE
jgi:DNA-directed RNA polymerase subunit E'/Rpb7